MTAVAAAPAVPGLQVRTHRRVPVSSVAGLAFMAAGALHLVAAIIHVPVLATGHVGAGQHLAGGNATVHWLTAVTLAVLAVIQFFVGGALWVSPLPALGVIGIVINSVAVCLYVMSRTVGLPFGQDPWNPEEVGLLDLTVAAVEVAGIVALTACLPTRTRAKATNVLLAVGVAMLGVRLLAGVLG